MFYVKALTSKIKSTPDKSKTKKWKSEDKAMDREVLLC
jgi:hypothetical protein